MFIIYSPSTILYMLKQRTLKKTVLSTLKIRIFNIILAILLILTLNIVKSWQPLHTEPNFESMIKDTKATCVKIATEMKKCSRLREMSNFNVLCNFQPI